MFFLARRRFLVMVVALLTMVAGMAYNQPQAEACSCQSFTPEEFLDEHLDDPSLVLFTGRQIDRDKVGYELTLTFDVERVFAGDITGDTTDLRVQLGTSCGGGSVRRLGRRAFIGWQGQDPEQAPHLGVCGTSLAPDLVEAYVDGFPEPASTGTPGFVVAQYFLDSQLAVLDQRGRVVHYDRSFDRRVTQIAACPGGESVLVLSVDPVAAYDSDSETLEYHLDTFAVDDLSLTTHRSFEYTNKRRDFVRVGQVRCHDRAGQDATHLEMTNNRKPAPTLVRWDGDARTETFFGRVRDLGVNKKGTRAVTLSTDGRTATVHNLVNGTAGDPVEMPGETVGWLVDIAARDNVYILGRSAQVEGPNSHIPDFNQVTRAQLSGLTLVGGSSQILGGVEVFGEGDGAIGRDLPSGNVWNRSIVGDGIVAQFSNQSADGKVLAIFIGPNDDDTKVDFHQGYDFWQPIAMGRKVTLGGPAQNSSLGKIVANKSKARPIAGIVGGYLAEPLATPRSPVTN